VPLVSVISSPKRTILVSGPFVGRAVSWLHRSSSPGMEPRTVFRACGLTLCNVLLESKNSGLAPFRATGTALTGKRTLPLSSWSQRISVPSLVHIGRLYPFSCCKRTTQELTSLSTLCSHVTWRVCVFQQLQSAVPLYAQHNACLAQCYTVCLFFAGVWMDLRKGQVLSVRMCV
jgi:hypothetical protein